MRGLRLGLSLGRGQAGTPAPFSVTFTGLSTDSIGTYGQIGNHASIGYTKDPVTGTETVKWSNSSNPADAATYGTGAAPTDFTASDGSPVYLHVTDGGDTVTRSFTVRKAPATGGADLDLAFPEDSAISATDLLANWTANGNTLTFVSVSPALPTGLSIDSAGEMTGTPTTVTADDTYTLTMEDEYGRETSDTFTLEVTAVVNPDFTNLTFADPGTGTPDTLTATYTYAGADTLVAYVATRNGGTALTAAQLAAGTGTFLERVVVDPFSASTFDLTGFTSTSEAATRIDMAIAEKNNGGISTAREVTVSGLDFTTPTRSSIATDAVDGTTVIVTYNENIYGTEDTTDWTISGHTVSNVAISGTTVTLTITPAIANGDSDTLSYSGGDLSDGDGNAVATFTTQAITNNVPASGPNFQAIGTNVYPVTTAVAWPAHATNDIGVLLVVSDGDQSDAATPSGWTALSIDNTGAVAGWPRMNAFYKVAASGAESSVTITGPTSKATAVIITVRGASTVATLGATSRGTTTSLTMTSGTTGGADRLIMGLVGVRRNVETDPFTSWTNANLASLTDRGGGFENYFGTVLHTCFFTGEKATAGAVGSTTATMAGTAHRWGGIHLEFA